MNGLSPNIGYKGVMWLAGGREYVEQRLVPGCQLYTLLAVEPFIELQSVD